MKMAGVKWRGVGSVIGSFLIQMTVGSFVGTVGNMLPYFTSYMRWTGIDVTIGDLALVQAVGGIFQGIMFMVGGLIVVPYLGLRGCLYLSCGMYISGSLLTYWTLDFGLPAVVITYGIFSASAMNMALVPTFLLPTAWFPEHRGKIIGIVQAGFGLASTLFTPLQTFLINPHNIPPSYEKVTQDVAFGRPTLGNATIDTYKNVSNHNAVKYFTDEDVLKRIPSACLYLSAVYGVILILGLFLAVGPPEEISEQTPKVNRSSKVKEAVRYLVKKTFTRKDFYLLFLSRLFPLVVVGGLLGHWKTLSLTVTDDDQFVSVIGSINGILNCLSRFIAGLLMDHLTFRHIMPAGSFLLAGVVASLVFVSRVSLVGFLVCLWSSYFLACTHFATVPAQAIKLFGNEQSNVVIGTIGLADAFSYLTLGILNQIFFSIYVTENSFVYFFLCLTGCAASAIVVNALVSLKPKKEALDAFLMMGNAFAKQSVSEIGNADTVASQGTHGLTGMNIGHG